MMNEQFEIELVKEGWVGMWTQGLRTNESTMIYSREEIVYMNFKPFLYLFSPSHTPRRISHSNFFPSSKTTHSSPFKTRPVQKRIRKRKKLALIIDVIYLSSLLDSYQSDFFFFSLSSRIPSFSFGLVSGEGGSFVHTFLSFFISWACLVLCRGVLSGRLRVVDHAGELVVVGTLRSLFIVGG